mgnify:CR=1 FL=1
MQNEGDYILNTAIIKATDLDSIPTHDHMYIS